MLAPDDADLVARDAAVPGLRVVLDPRALAGRLAEAAGGDAVDRVEATYVRYKPHSSCIVSLRVERAGQVTHGYAKAHRRGDDDKAGKLLDAVPGRRRGAVDVGDGVVVTFFPRDADLRVEQTCADARRRRILRRLLPRRPDLWSGTLHVLSYKPERRCVARLDGPHGPATVLRWYARGGFDRALSASAAVHAVGALGDVRVPTVLGSVAHDRVFAVDWMRGEPLRPSKLPGDAEASWADAGRALHGLHGQSVRGLVQRTRRSETAAVGTAAEAVGAVAPHLRDEASRLSRSLRRTWAHLPAVGQVIHGDFSADQVVVGADGAALVDLDEAALGDPASDLAQFRANLVADVTTGRLSAAASQRCWDGLLAGYAATGAVLDRVGPYTATWLLRLAVEPFRHRLPGWQDKLARILAAAADERRWRP